VAWHPIYGQKSKQENQLRKRVTQQWETLLRCYLNEVAWGVGKHFGSQLEFRKSKRHAKNKDLLETLLKTQSIQLKFKMPLRRGKRQSKRKLNKTTLNKRSVLGFTTQQISQKTNGYYTRVNDKQKKGLIC
jgi:hypothetical protein